MFRRETGKLTLGQKRTWENSKTMRRERVEIGWYAVRPSLFYLVLFITIRAILYRVLEAVLLTSGADMALYYEVWSGTADILILGLSCAGAVIPVLGEGRREVMLARARSDRAWIAKRKDCNILIAVLPAGTICLSAFLNIVLAQWSAGSYTDPVSVPLAAAVYGFLTPFTEELVFRGIMYHRLRRGFSPLQSALICAILFGIAHGTAAQGLYAAVMGIVFALSFELTRRFEVPYLLHCTCNLAVLAAGAAGWREVLSGPMWTVFFAVCSAAVFGYWGKRLHETKFKF